MHLSSSTKKNRIFQKSCDKRSHNQFITIALSEGLFGIVVFLGCLVLIYKQYKGSLNYLFILGQMILLISMLWEDTLETQAGVAIFALLLNLFLFETSYASPLKEFPEFWNPNIKA
jgi:membrane-bound ClpP family serine protease